MITEKQFIFNFSFFWRSLLPTSSLFVAKLNDEFYGRRLDHLNSIVDGRRRSFSSYVSFNLFADTVSKGLNLETMTDAEYRTLETSYRDRFRELAEQDWELYRELSAIELIETKEISRRLLHVFGDGDSVTPNPHFKGCGFLEDCYGDVIFEDTLYEIKMVERNFRLVDCKQLITYCALNYSSKQYHIQNVALFNPRNGKISKHNIDDFCFMISGKSSMSLFSEVIEFVSGGGVSR